MKKFSFIWVTGILFLGSFVGHWIFGWYDYVAEQSAHMQAPQASEYLIKMMRDTLENWQSEFLQLMWQVAGLAMLYYAGSPQSRGDDERMEEKLDAILRRLDPSMAENVIRDLDKRFPGRRPNDTL